MAGYYKTIKGKRYDRSLLDLADSLTTGGGDGRISLQDAKAIFKKVTDGSTYTDTEKATMQYIRDNYRFTESADKWFRAEIRSWAATKKKSAPKAVKKTAKKTQKKSSKKTAAKKKTKKAAKKTTSKKAPKAAAKKTAKKTIKKTAAPKKAAPSPVTTPEPEETYLSAAPAPSPILQQQMNEKENKGGSSKLFIAFLVIAALAAIIYFAFFKKSPETKPDIARKAPPAKVKLKEKKPAPEPAKTVTFKKQGPAVASVENVKIYFAKGSGWINHKERKKLIPIIDYMKKNQGRKLIIVGEACSLGTPKLNNDLSLYRARNAARYLAKKGIPRDRIIIRGVGEKGINGKNENLWKNRVIEFDVQ